MLGMKWVAYAKAHIEGDDYYLSYGFEIPEDLYNYLINEVYYNRPIRDCEKYDELVKYAEIALDCRKLCGYYDDDFVTLQEGENADDGLALGGYIQEFNMERKRINSDVKYTRIFDPKARERFIDYCCLEMEVKPEYIGKTMSFSCYYFEESYEWDIVYTEDDCTVMPVIAFVPDDEYPVKKCNGEWSLYPPYDELVEKLKTNDVIIREKR